MRRSVPATGVRFQVSGAHMSMVQRWGRLGIQGLTEDLSSVTRGIHTICTYICIYFQIMGLHPDEAKGNKVRSLVLSVFGCVLSVSGCTDLCSCPCVYMYVCVAEMCLHGRAYWE